MRRVGFRRRRAVVCAAIARLYVGAAYDSIDNPSLCPAKVILLLTRDRGEPHGSELGTARYMVEHTNARLLADKDPDHQHDKTSGDRLRPTWQRLRLWAFQPALWDALTAAYFAPIYDCGGQAEWIRGSRNRG
jgi:hypothetical protein